jgi:hypothetical protein
MKKSKRLDQLFVFGVALLCFAFTVSAMDQATGNVEDESKSVFERSPEWYLKNWPSKASQNGFSEIDNGKHTWKNSKGSVVGEVLIKNSQPFSGITFIQGASDYRMVTLHENGKPRLLTSHLFKNGHWTIFQNNLSGEQDGADQPATAPESKSEGKKNPKPEAEARSK